MVHTPSSPFVTVNGCPIFTETRFAWGSWIRNCARRSALMRGYSWSGRFPLDGFHSFSTAAITGALSRGGTGAQGRNLHPATATKARLAASPRDQTIFRLLVVRTERPRASLLGNEK